MDISGQDRSDDRSGRGFGVLRIVFGEFRFRRSPYRSAVLRRSAKRRRDVALRHCGIFGRHAGEPDRPPGLDVLRLAGRLHGFHGGHRTDPHRANLHRLVDACRRTRALEDRPADGGHHDGFHLVSFRPDAVDPLARVLSWRHLVLVERARSKRVRIAAFGISVSRKSRLEAVTSRARKGVGLPLLRHRLALLTRETLRSLWAQSPKTR